MVGEFSPLQRKIWLENLIADEIIQKYLNSEGKNGAFYIGLLLAANIYVTVKHHQISIVFQPISLTNFCHISDH